MNNYLHKFGATVSSLTAYKEEETDLVAKAIYGAKIIGLLQKSGNVMVGYNNQTVALNNLTNNVNFQAYGCGFTTSGSTVFAQESITVKHLQLTESICPSDFESVWMGKLLQNKTTPVDLPFGKYIVESKAEAMKSEVDYMAWQGDTVSGTHNLVKVDGFIKFLSGKTTTYVATASGATHTTSNILARVDALINNLSEKVMYRDDLYLHMSLSNFRTYTQALTAEKYYQLVWDNTSEFTIYHPNTNIRVIGEPGMRALNTWYLTPLSNMKFITNLMDDTERLEYWYDKSSRTGKIEGAMFLGFGFNEPAMVVHNNSALQ